MNVITSLRKQYKGRVGRNRYPVKVLHAKVRDVLLLKRGTFPALSSAIGVSHMILHRAYKRGDLESETRRAKPLLTLQNRIERVHWCLSHVNEQNTSLLQCRNDIERQTVHAQRRNLGISPQASQNSRCRNGTIFSLDYVKSNGTNISLWR